jgi:hypothetical protein
LIELAARSRRWSKSSVGFQREVGDGFDQPPGLRPGGAQPTGFRHFDAALPRLAQ